MTTEIATKGTEAEALELALLGDDLSKLSPPQRLYFYNRTCESLGLNPLTKPFSYITLNGKLTLYAKRDCTDQLRKIHGVSVTDLADYTDGEGTYVVTAKGRDRDGRVDAAKGAVFLGAMKGEMRANAIMKAETKAKRRLTLSLCGLGILDETEADSIAGAVLRDTDVVHNIGNAPEVNGKAASPAPAAPPKDEASELLLLPEEDRVYLIAEIKKLGKNIPAGDKAEAAVTYLGLGVSLEQADTSALSDLLRWVQARTKR